MRKEKLIIIIMSDNWIETFDAAFWLTMSGAFFGFLALLLQSILKSRCKTCSFCFGLWTCERDPAPPGMEPELNTPKGGQLENKV